MKSAELEEKGSDIWQLFREAQQSKLLLMYFVCPSLLRPVLTHLFLLNGFHLDILYLNKQRIMTMEELDRVKREKSSLLDQIEQLERTKLINTRKGSGTILAIFLYLLQDQSESFLQCKIQRYPTREQPRNPQRTPRAYLKIR